MVNFTPISALIGGTLIGLSAVLLLKLNGRIAGISGMINGALTGDSNNRWWRLLFLLGLIAGGALFQAGTGEPMVTRQDFSTGLLIIAGLLVGIGTRIGSGCTSGHGVCGLARLSPRSLTATVTFVSVGMATATVVYLIAGNS